MIDGGKIWGKAPKITVSMLWEVRTLADLGLNWCAGDSMLGRGKGKFWSQKKRDLGRGTEFGVDV